jgi:hypothetical protein
MLQRFSSTGPLARVNLQQLLHEIQIKHITGFQPMLQIGHLRYQDLNLSSFDLLPRIIAQVWIILALAIIQKDLHRLTRKKTYILVQQLFLLSEELANQLPIVHHILREGSDDPNDPRELPLHCIVLEQHPSGPQLRQDTAKTPHIDLVVILAANDDLRRPIAPGLDVA